MNEQPETPEQSRSEIIAKMVQDPQSYLERNKHKGCVAAIEFLLQVRNEIRGDSTISIERPDPLYRAFHQAGNADPVFYESLAQLLKNAGYDEGEVHNGFFDWLQQQVSRDAGLSNHLRTISTLAQAATTAVFAAA